MGACGYQKRKVVQVTDETYDEIRNKSVSVKEKNSSKMSRVIEFSSKGTVGSYPSSPIRHRDHGSLTDFNVVIYGPPDSGKSTFGLNLIKKKMTNFYIPSLFTEIYKTEVVIDSKPYHFTVTIPNSKEEAALIEKADCYFIFFDISSEKSFEQTKKLLNKKFKKCKVPLFLVGNKCDRKKTLSEMTIQNFCKQKYFFVELSSLTGIGVINLMKIAGEKLTSKKN